jgi:hypothetical protein
MTRPDALHRSAAAFVLAVASVAIIGCTPTGAAPTPTAPAATGTGAPATTSAAPTQSTTATAPASGAGSLVYIMDFNVWLAAPDGTSARQLTNDGTESAGYRDPSQANSGAIFALRGSSSLVRIDRAGGGPGPAVQLATLENGAEGLSVSPNGTYLAYATTGFGTEIDPRFGTPVSTFLYGGTDIATTDGASLPGAALPSLLFPDWLDDSHLVAADGVSISFATVGTPATTWLITEGGCLIEFDCPSGTPAEASLSQPVVSADGTLLAYSYEPYFGPAGRRIASITGAPPAAPTEECLLTGQHDHHNPGTFSPDNSAFAFDDTIFDPAEFEVVPGQGLFVMDLDLEAVDCGLSTAQLIVPGATQPDWGPAAP